MFKGTPSLIYAVLSFCFNAAIHLVWNGLCAVPKTIFKTARNKTPAISYNFIKPAEPLANTYKSKTEPPIKGSSQIINKPQGEVWRGRQLPLHFQSILAACTAKSRVFTKRSD